MEMALWVLVVLVFFVGLSMEMKLSRANRIARASHDLLKQILEEVKRQRTEDRGQRTEGEWKAPPMPTVAAEETKTERSVYKI